MNIPFAAAGGLTTITVLAHVIGGTPEFMEPIYQSNAPDFNKIGMSVIWHWVTAAMSINAIALFIAAKSSRYALPISAFVISQFMAFGLIFFWYGATHFGSLLTMAQWIAFFLISALTFWGMRKTDLAKDQIA